MFLFLSPSLNVKDGVWSLGLFVDFSSLGFSAFQSLWARSQKIIEQSKTSPTKFSFTKLPVGVNF